MYQDFQYLFSILISECSRDDYWAVADQRLYDSALLIQPSVLQQHDSNLSVFSEDENGFKMQVVQSFGSCL